MAGLPAVGTLYYNGVSFAGADTVKVSTVFVLDDAKRTVTHHEITIDVVAIVAAVPTDTDLLTIRAALSKAGQELKFLNRGFGTDIWINRPGGSGLRDMKWGPIPEILEWEPIGSANACQIHWRVKTCIPVCDISGVHKTTGVMAFNYEAAFTVNKKGFTTRRVTGYIEIAQTRRVRAVPDSADLYRNLITATAPLGFERDQRDYGTSLDKSRLTFTIVDKEIESKNPYPKNVISVSMRHAAHWTRSGDAGAVLRSTISGEVVLKKDADWVEAFIIFSNVVAKRMQAAFSKGLWVFLDSLSIDEDIFGYANSFSASYHTINPTMAADNPNGLALNDLKSIGLWHNVGGNWNLWRQSLATAQGSSRGYAELFLGAGDDTIVDICGGLPEITDAAATIQQQPSVSPAKVFKNQVPPPNKSYLRYQMQQVLQQNSGAVRQSTMQSPGQIPTGSMLDSQFPTMGEGVGNVQIIPGVAGVDDVIQRAGRLTHLLWLIGHAVRVGRPIPKPTIQAVGSQDAEEVEANFVQQHLGNFFGVDLYQAAWRIQYALKNAPGAVQVLKNLSQGSSSNLPSQ